MQMRNILNLTDQTTQTYIGNRNGLPIGDEEYWNSINTATFS